MAEVEEATAPAVRVAVRTAVGENSAVQQMAAAANDRAIRSIAPLSNSILERQMTGQRLAPIGLGMGRSDTLSRVMGLQRSGPSALEQQMARAGQRLAPIGLGLDRKFVAPIGLGLDRKLVAPVGLGLDRKLVAPVGLGLDRKLVAPVGLGLDRKLVAPVGLGLDRKLVAPVGLGLDRKFVAPIGLGLGRSDTLSRVMGLQRSGPSALEQQMARAGQRLAPIGLGIENPSRSQLLESRIAEMARLVAPTSDVFTKQIAEVAKRFAPLPQDLQRDMAQVLASVVADVECLDSPSDFGAAVDSIDLIAPEVGEQVRSLRSREEIVVYLNLLTAILTLIALAWGALDDDEPINQTIINNDIHVTYVTVLPPPMPVPPVPLPPSAPPTGSAPSVAGPTTAGGHHAPRPPSRRSGHCGGPACPSGRS